MKAVKNEVEIQGNIFSNNLLSMPSDNFPTLPGFINCHIRDSAALCTYLAWLEEMLNKNEPVDEITGNLILALSRMISYFIIPVCRCRQTRADPLSDGRLRRPELHHHQRLWAARGHRALQAQARHSQVNKPFKKS